MEEIVSSQTYAWVEIAKIAIPVVLGAVVWALQTLAQRAWNEYEARRLIYSEIVRSIDSLFESGDPSVRAKYLANVRAAWLIASDDVVLAANYLTDAIKTGSGNKEMAYSAFIAAMRRDLHRWRFMPPRRTKLDAKNFPVEAPGQDLR